MSDAYTKQVEILLADAQNPESHSKLIQLVYGELRQMAARSFKQERTDHTLQPTALVHELFIRLAGNGPTRYESRGHFFAVAARAMRQILVEHGRARKSQKRGAGWQRVALEDTQVAGPQSIDYLALDALLCELERFDEQLCRIVELRIFAGLTSEEIAQELNIGESTARKYWTQAKMWLERELQRDES